MFAHILVPLDGSEYSEKALEPAFSMAEKYGARVTLLTVMIRFPESKLHVPVMDERSEERGRGYLEEALARAGQPARATDLVVRLGLPADEIMEFAETSDVDLIVMSTHGTTGTDRFRHSIGSTAWKVLQHAPCPVLLVPVHPPAPAGD